MQRPQYTDEYKSVWQCTDDLTYDHPETVGRCVRISCIDSIPVGMVSWDPRNAPASGEIGQHCILPAWRGKGYGRQQLLHAMTILQTMGVQQIRVTTEDHPFYLPAQRLYHSLGFIENGRKKSGLYGGIELIYFELKVKPS